MLFVCGAAAVAGVLRPVQAESLSANLAEDEPTVSASTVTVDVGNSQALSVALAHTGRNAGEDLVARPDLPRNDESSDSTGGGEWAMGNRSLGRDGDGTFNSVISVPLRTKWASEAAGKVQVNPAVVDDVAYYGGAGADNKLYAVGLQSGSSLEWTFAAGGSILSAPAVTGDWVYFGSADGRLYRVSAGRKSDGGGAPSWQFPATTQDPIGAIIGGPAVVDGTVYFGSTDGNVYAVNAATGELLWKAATPEAIRSSVAVSGGLVVATSGVNEDITAFDARTGNKVWTRHLFDSTSETLLGTAPAIAQGRVYATGFSGTLHAMSLNSGIDLYPAKNLGAPAQSTPVVTDGGIYVGTNDSKVWAFNLSGQPQWVTALPSGGIIHAPSFAGGYLFAASTSGVMNVLEINGGLPQWTFQAGAMFAAPSIVSNYVLVGSDDGHLYALTPGLPENATDGSQPFSHYGPGMQGDQNYESDPVSTSTGNLLHQRTDISTVSGRGAPVSFARTYNSLSAGTDGLLGFGWSTNVGARISDPVGPPATITWGDGRSDLYTESTAGVFTGPKDSHTILKRTADGWVLSDIDADSTASFDTTGQLRWLDDKNGNRTQYTYLAGKLTSIRDASNRSITLTYNAAGRIATAQGPLTQQRWQYGYSAAGDLTRVTDPRGRVWVYNYDTQHRLTSAVDPAAKPIMTNTYLGITGKIATQADGTGKVWTFAYSPDHTVVTDPTGVSYTDYFDANYRTVRTVNATGSETRRVFDAASNLIATTDTAGETERFTYNAKGYLTAHIDALGHKTGFTYDNAGNLTSKTSLKGRSTVWEYDTRGNITAVTAPTGERSTLQYRPDGLVATTARADGGTTTFEYSPTGLVTASTDGRGNRTTYANRADGRPTSMTDPLGATIQRSYDALDRQSSVTDPLGHARTWSYNDRGETIEAIDPKGHITTYVYDAAGRVTGVEDPLDRKTTMTYDPAGRPATRTDARGLTTTNTYSSAGLLAATVSPDQRVDYTYDTADRVTSVKNATTTLTYSYDELSRVRTETNSATGITLTRGWDVLGRPAHLRVGSGTTTLATTRSTWDASGRPLNVIDANGRRSHFTYDPVGRLKELIRGNGTQTSYGYDRNDNVTEILNLPPSLTDLDGSTNGPAQHSADSLASAQRLVAKISEPENQAALDVTTATLTTLTNDLAADGLTVIGAIRLLRNLGTTLDALSDQVDETLDEETQTELEQTIADLGDSLQSVPATANTDQLTDAAEDLSDALDALTATVTGLENNLTQLTRLTADTTRLAATLVEGGSGAEEVTAVIENVNDLAADLPHDIARINTLLAATRELSLDLFGAAGVLQSKWKFTYDKANRQLTADRRFVGIGEEILSFTNTYTYDPAGKILTTATTDPASAVPGNATYTYDAAGNRTSVAPAGVAPQIATYDAADQRLTDGTNTLTYDPAGNVITVKPTGTTNPLASYQWDAQGRLIKSTTNQSTVDNVYDPLGRRMRSTTTHAGSSSETITSSWDNWNLAYTTTNAPAAEAGDTAYTTVNGTVLGALTPATSTDYLTDATGNVAEATDGFGNAISRHAYGPWGETASIKSPQTGATGQALTEHGYSGSLGVRETSDGLLDMRNRTYDPNLGMFLSRDPMNATTGEPYRYAYGNPVTTTDPYGLCGITDLGGCVDDVSNWVYDTVNNTGSAVISNSGAISSGLGLASAGFYGICAFGGVGCVVGSVLGGASLAFGAIDAGRTCFGGSTRDCLLEVGGLGFDYVGGRVTDSLVWSGRHVDDLVRLQNRGAWNFAFGTGSCAANEIAFQLFADQAQGCASELPNGPGWSK